MSGSAPKVGLFVTCLVDLFRPKVGFAAVKLLEQAGCEVEVPGAQTCCGQPSYNSGDRNDTVAIAKQVIAAFEAYDYVVVPSGSCAGMLKKHYPGLLKGDLGWQLRAQSLANKTHELVSFLTDVRGMAAVDAELTQAVTYHDSCSGLRELGVKQQPRQLLNSVKGCQVNEMQDAEVCCGFGGTFCVKYADISNAMVEKKIKNIIESKANVLSAGDLGCLMNMVGKLQREGSDIKAYHIAEILAGMADDGIGETS